MMVSLDGKIVPENEAKISVFDRSFLYGDGLFETMRLSRGKLVALGQHLERLQAGAAFLKIALSYSTKEFAAQATELIEANALTEGILRITVSRGVGERGYSPRGAKQPTVVMTLAAAPAIDFAKLTRWKVITASQRMPAGSPGAAFKTCNKILQVLARAEADERGVEEAILLNEKGTVAEGSSSNVFAILSGVVTTPPVAGTTAILPGVTRGMVLELCRMLKIPCAEREFTPKELSGSEGAFLTMSSRGLVEIAAVDGKEIPAAAAANKLYQAMEGAS